MKNRLLTIRISPLSGFCMGAKGSWEIIGGLQVPGEQVRKSGETATIYSDPEWIPNYCGPVPLPSREDFD